MREEFGEEFEGYLTGLRENDPTLTELSLYCDRIGDDGAASIAKALQWNRTLTVLNLQGNQIGDDGARVIARYLKENRALTKLALYSNKIGDDGAAAIEEGLQYVKTNKKMFSEDLLGGTAERYHDLNKLSKVLPVLPAKIYLTIIRDFLSATLLVKGSIEEKLDHVEMLNLKDPKLPNKDESAYLIVKAFEKFTQDVGQLYSCEEMIEKEFEKSMQYVEKYPEHFIDPYLIYGTEVAGPICASDSVLLEGFYQLYSYDNRLGNGIIHLQESEEGGKVYKTPTTTPFSQIKVDLDTLSRMLTNDVEKPEDKKEYKTIAGQQVELPGFDFAQIVEARRPILLLNIFTITQGVSSLMTAFEEKMQENDNALLNIVVEMTLDYPVFQRQLQQVIDRVGKIMEIVEDEISAEGDIASDKKRPRAAIKQPQPSIDSAGSAPLLGGRDRAARRL